VSRRVVIADAGPLIGLARIDSLALLRGLFGQVFITVAVRDELLPADASFPDTGLLTRTLAEGWVPVVESPLGDWKPLNPGVDPGEASALRVACRWRDAGDAVLLVMDNRAGRLEAKRQGIALIGTAAVIAVLLVMDNRAGRLEAKRQGIALIGTAAVIGLATTQGLTPAAKPLLERLARSGYCLGQAVIDAVLAAAGE